MGAGHISLNILYWTCTFNFRPKFEHRTPPPVLPNFSVHIAGYRILKKMKVIFFGIVFQKSILGSPDNTLSKF